MANKRYTWLYGRMFYTYIYLFINIEAITHLVFCYVVVNRKEKIKKKTNRDRTSEVMRVSLGDLIY